MPFPMKIQPIDSLTLPDPVRFETVKPVVVKSRLKRLFERQFSSVLRSPAVEKVGAAGTDSNDSAEFEPSSVCLDKMVRNFIEESHEKPTGAVKCGRSCFNRSSNDSSDEEFDSRCGSGDSDASAVLKSLVLSASVHERNLLADTAKIVEKSKICKRKDDSCRRFVTGGLSALGYDACVCKSRWEKSPSYPAGEYEYIDVFIRGERFLVDVDFRSEFEIARSTKAYRSVLNTLPYIFVGKSDRLQKIIGVVSDAAKQSLKKKGMHVPPWRKAEYVMAKWLSPPTRSSNPSPETKPDNFKPPSTAASGGTGPSEKGSNSVDEAELEFEESVFAFSERSWEVERSTAEKGAWKPPEIKMKSSQIGAKLVTGLTSVIEEDKTDHF